MVVLPLRPMSNIDPQVCHLLSGLLLGNLDNVGGLSTVSKGDVEAMLGVERQKDLLGCSTTACMAEIGGALGAELVLYGEVGVIGNSYTVNLNIVSARDSMVAGRVSKLLPKDEDSLALSIPAIVSDVVEKLNSR